MYGSSDDPAGSHLFLHGLHLRSPYRKRREMERGRCWDVAYEMKGEEGLLIAMECLVLVNLV